MKRRGAERNMAHDTLGRKASISCVLLANIKSGETAPLTELLG